MESLQLSALLSPDSVISRKHIIDHITNIVNGSIDIKSSLNVNSDIKDDDASSEVTSKQSLTKEKRDSLFKVMNLTQISVASDDSLVGVKLAEQEKRNESGINDNVISSERNENISSSVMRISGLTRHLSPIDTNSVHEVLSPIVDRHALSKTPNRKAFAEYIQKKIMSSIANSSFYKSAQVTCR